MEAFNYISIFFVGRLIKRIMNQLNASENMVGNNTNNLLHFNCHLIGLEKTE